MADPMWSGGAEQFQDRYPYVWFIMGEFNRGPFYPTDPPRSPGAFYDSVAPMLDFPGFGTAYAPFVSQYGTYYAEQWQLNPPATSTDVGNAPAQDDDTSLALKIDLLINSVLSLHTKMGTFVETDTTASLLYFLSQQITGLPGPITGYATGTDSARILAGLYYIAQAVIVPVWEQDNTEVMAGLEAMTTSFSEQHAELDTHLDSQDTAATANAEAINANIDAAEVAIIADTGATEAAVLDALAEVQADTDSLQSSATTALADLNEIQATLAGMVIPTSGGLRWPGLASVTLSNPVVVSEPAQIDVTCHGCLVDVLSYPGGQSRQGAGDAMRFKGIGWLGFQNDNGDFEALDQINFGRQVLLAKQLTEATGLAVYCKPGAEMRVTPFTLTPA